MWGFFGGAKKQDPKDTIISLRQQIIVLNKKNDNLIVQIHEQENLARKHVTTNKLMAKNALKKKKNLEKQQETVQGSIDSLQTSINTLETANLNLETMKAMQEGAKAMKQIHGNMNIDKVDKIMDETRDQVALSEEVSEAISRPYANAYDDEELEDELEALEQETLEGELTNAGHVKQDGVQVTPHDLPAAPNQVPAEEEDDEEEELRRLQREMAL